MQDNGDERVECGPNCEHDCVCSSDLCFNGGICKENPNAPKRFECACTGSYKGTLCEKRNDKSFLRLIIIRFQILFDFFNHVWIYLGFEGKGEKGSFICKLNRGIYVGYVVAD